MDISGNCYEQLAQPGSLRWRSSGFTSGIIAKVKAAGSENWRRQDPDRCPQSSMESKLMETTVIAPLTAKYMPTFSRKKHKYVNKLHLNLAFTWLHNSTIPETVYLRGSQKISNLT
jgi:hypothetical protein